MVFRQYENWIALSMLKFVDIKPRLQKLSRVNRFNKSRDTCVDVNEKVAHFPPSLRLILDRNEPDQRIPSVLTSVVSS